MSKIQVMHPTEDAFETDYRKALKRAGTPNVSTVQGMVADLLGHSADPAKDDADSLQGFLMRQINAKTAINSLTGATLAKLLAGLMREAQADRILLDQRCSVTILPPLELSDTEQIGIAHCAIQRASRDMGLDTSFSTSAVEVSMIISSLPSIEEYSVCITMMVRVGEEYRMARKSYHVKREPKS